MDQTNSFYINNLEVLADAARACDESSLDLNAYSRGFGDAQRNCLAGLLARLAYFQNLGVRRANDGAPELRGPGGLMREPEETATHLFGTFLEGGIFAVLFNVYGEGSFDQVLMRRAGGLLSHRQLALARLYFVLEALMGQPVPLEVDRPAAPGGEDRALGLTN